MSRSVCPYCGKSRHVSSSSLQRSLSQAIAHLECYVRVRGHRPLAVTQLERRQQRDINQILISGAQQMLEQQLLDLGISSKTLARWVKRYLGLTLGEYVAKHGSDQRKQETPGVGRSQVSSLDQLVDTVATDGILDHAQRLRVSPATISRAVRRFGMDYREFRERALSGDLG